MAKYPGATYRPLDEKQGQGKMARHDIVCLHTMVGYLSSTDAMFRRGGWSGTESHFGVGGKWGGDEARNLDGVVYQWQDTGWTADANLDGNRRIISIETADNAPGLAKDIQDWTPKQLDAIARIVAWACRTHDIPPVLIPDSKPGRRGIGYHRQGCEHSLGPGKVPGFLVVGGERWSNAKGKECPGPRRIAQIKTIIIPRVQALLKPKPAAPRPPASKPPVVKEPTVADALRDYKLTLATQVQVNRMNASNPAVPYKIGDTLDFDRLMMWGGPGIERIFQIVADLQQENEDQQLADEKAATQLQRIEDAITVLAARLGPPTATGEPRSV